MATTARQRRGDGDVHRAAAGRVGATAAAGGGDAAGATAAGASSGDGQRGGASTAASCRSTEEADRASLAAETRNKDVEGERRANAGVARGAFGRRQVERPPRAPLFC